MSNRHNVFISSTSIDLLEYRIALRDIIIKVGMFPFDMKDFDATSESPMQTCYTVICKADLFVGVYAYRYGYIPPVDVSYRKQDGTFHTGDGETAIIEWEYKWALEREIPMLLFLIESDANWRVSHIEAGENFERLEEFKNLISRKHTVKFFRDIEDFNAAMAIELSKAKEHLDSQALDKAARSKSTIEQVAIRSQHALDASAKPQFSPSQTPRVIGTSPKTFESNKFHDRATELQRISKALTAGKPLVSIYGRGGIGKTALACKGLADFEKGNNYDGLAYFDLKNSPRSLLGELARFFAAETEIYNILNDITRGTEQKTRALIEAMHGKRYIVLLDNLETIQDKITHKINDNEISNFIRTVLQHRAECLSLIVTSRLNIHFDNVLKPYEETISLGNGLPPADALSFLRELDPDGSLLPKEDKELLHWANRVDFIPRALEALIGYLRGGISRTLNDLLNDESLFEGEIVANVVHRILEELPQTFLMVMQGVAIAGQAPTRPMLEYLLAPYLDTTVLRQILERLVDRYVLYFNQETDTYSLHPYDRDYVLAQLPEENQDGDVGQISFTFFSLHQRMADYHRHQRLPRDSWRTLNDVQSQLNEIEHRIAIHDYNTAARIINQIGHDYLLKWGYASHIRTLIERIQVHIDNKFLIVESFGLLGKAYIMLDQSERAIDCYKQSYNISCEIRDRSGEANWLKTLGITYCLAEHHQEALDSLEQALALMYERNDLLGQIHCFLGLGLTYESLSDFERAIDLYRHALNISRDINNQNQEILYLTLISSIYSDMGDTEQATSLCEQALSISHDINDKGGEKNCLMILSSIYSDMGDTEQAINLCEQARTICRDINDHYGEYNCLTTLGSIFKDTGQPAYAIEIFEQALSVSRKVNNKSQESAVLCDLGEALSILERHSLAINMYNKAIQIQQEHGSFTPICITGATTGLARAQAYGKQAEKALSTIRTVEDLITSSESYDASCWLGILEFRHENLERAQQAFKDAVSYANSILQRSEHNYDALFNRGLAQVGLYLLGNSHSLQAARKDYRQAEAQCLKIGVHNAARRDLGYLLENNVSITVDDLLDNR